MQLHYKTKNNDTNKNKEKVYFTCHHEDFEKYFDYISTDIFKTQNCAVYYFDDLKTELSQEQLDLEIAQMQLMVIPITSKFLSEENRARLVEFKYAMEHHIPVLPIMLEKGLEQPFNSLCGDLHFLERDNKACASSAYTDKLEKYLNNVLLGGELSEKIKNAFDAYIFLSYRKKDRKYAQELMKLIHKNDFCRDIAIWYDEFLTPGESFNTAISEAMLKSKLFALVVTPNLICEDNYVMQIEYPAAVKGKMKILPAEMVETDKIILYEKYKNIPQPISSDDENGFKLILSESFAEEIKRLAISEHNTNAQHLFFIGLAYLSGVDVEKDYDRAVNLITSSAEKGLKEAITKLSFMYRNGEGVERNYAKAIEWKEKLIHICKQEYIRNNTEIFSLLIEVSDFLKLCFESFSVEKASLVCKDILILVKKHKPKKDLLEFLPIIGFMKQIASSCDIESVSSSKNKEEPQDKSSTYNLFFEYLNMGEKAKSQKKFDEAEKYYIKASEFAKEKLEEKYSPMHNEFLALSYSAIGDIYKEQRDFEKAEAYYIETVKINEMNLKEVDSNETRTHLANSYNDLRLSAQVQGNFDDEEKYCIKMLPLLEKNEDIGYELSNRNDFISNRKSLFLAYYYTAKLYEKKNDLEKAEKYCYKAVIMQEKIAEENNTASELKRLDDVYTKMTEILKALNKYKECKIYMKKSLKITTKLFFKVLKK